MFGDFLLPGNAVNTFIRFPVANVIADCVKLLTFRFEFADFATGQAQQKH